MDAKDYNAREIAAGRVTAQQLERLLRETRVDLESEVRTFQRLNHLQIDGKIGPETRVTLGTCCQRSTPRLGTQWSLFDGPLVKQPRNRREVVELFGKPGASKLDGNWYAENIVELHGKTRLPGVPTKWYVQVHRFVEPYLREGLRRATQTGYRIDRIGCFNYRHIRHDSSRPLSMHSWGIAVDINPNKNKAMNFKRGKAPKAWGAEYWQLWPDGIPWEFVDAMASCGWAWGSDWDEDGRTDDHTYLDPMHFEWVARDGNAMNV